MKPASVIAGCVVLFALAAGSAGAADYNWDGAAGGAWKTNSNWSPDVSDSSYYDYGSGYTFLLDNPGEKATADGGTFGATLTLGSGSELSVSAASVVSNLVVGDGVGGATISIAAKDTYTLSGSVSVQNESQIRSEHVSWGGGSALDISAALSNSGGLILLTKYVPGTDSAGGISQIKLSGDNSGYSGNIIVTNSGYSVGSGANALGTGTITIRNGAQLRLMGVTVPGQLNVEAGGTLGIDSGGATCNNLNVGDSNGSGTLAVTFQGGWNTETLNGAVSLASTSAIQNLTGIAFGSATLNMNATLSGVTALTLTTKKGTADEITQIRLSGDNSGLSGTVAVRGDGGRVQLNHLKALGDKSCMLDITNAGVKVEYLLGTLTNVNVTGLVLGGVRLLGCPAGTGYDITQTDPGTGVNFADYFIGTAGETIRVFEPTRGLVITLR